MNNADAHIPKFFCLNEEQRFCSSNTSAEFGLLGIAFKLVMQMTIADLLLRHEDFFYDAASGTCIR